LQRRGRLLVPTRFVSFGKSWRHGALQPRRIFLVIVHIIGCHRVPAWTVSVPVYANRGGAPIGNRDFGGVVSGAMPQERMVK
jgi:hypothetical protein